MTEAISHQGLSFADQVVGVVRKHSRNADDRVERVARRIVRRRPRDLADADTRELAGFAWAICQIE